MIRRASRPARMFRSSPSPYRQGFVVGLCVGTTLALVVGALGYVLAQPNAAAPTAARGTDAGGAPATSSRPASAQAAIDVQARHLGDLQVQIEAQVSAPTSYDPITRAQVVAYTDMVAMPMAHRQGPIVMAEVSGRPGVYQALATVPMIGEYDVAVEVRQPMAASAHERLKVDAVRPPP